MRKGMQQWTEETYIRQMPYSAIRYLSFLIDVDELWKKLVMNIPRRLEYLSQNHNEYEKRYSQLQIRVFEDKNRRPDGSPTKSVLDDWGTQNARIKHLLRVLQLAALYDAADYISETVLQKEPIARLANVSECVSISQLPRPCWADAHMQRPFASESDIKRTAPPLSENDPIYNSLYKGASKDATYNQLTPVYNRITSFDSGGNPSVPLQDGATSDPQENTEPETLQIRQFSGDSLLKDTSLSQIKLISPSEKMPPSLPPKEATSPPPKKPASPPPVRSRQRVPCESPDNETEMTETHIDNIFKKLGSQQINYTLVDEITDNFNKLPQAEGGRLIGTGGFGEVFLGIFHNGCKVAVKRLKNVDESEKHESEKQFNTELTSLTKYRHKHIVNLYGFSTDGPSKCLVYEYLSKGSLEDRLVRKDKTPPLEVPVRISILQGTAKGIDFLNQNGIVHRDVKSANVLLNEHFQPKVGDFATARGGPHGNGTAAVSTKVVIGTTAYLAPEAYYFDISTKLDSYSFGIVIYEVLTALPSLDETREERDIKSHVEENDVQPDMSGGQWNKKDVEKLMNIASRCTEHKKNKRANISDILPELLALPIH